MVTPERKAEIARENGRKTKGAVTAHGKLMSSLNRFKHGLERGTVAHILVSDDADEFQSFVDGLTERYDPQSPVEAHLIEVVAMAMVRQRRLWKVDIALTNVEILQTQKKALYPDSVVHPVKDYWDSLKEEYSPKVITYREALSEWRSLLTTAIGKLEQAIANAPQGDADVWSKSAAIADTGTWLDSVHDSFSEELSSADAPWSKKLRAFYRWLDPWVGCQPNCEDDPDKAVVPRNLPTVTQVIARIKKVLKILNDQLAVADTQIAEHDEVDAAIEAAVAQAQGIAASINHGRADLIDRYQRSINRDLYKALDSLESFRRERALENSAFPVGSYRRNTPKTVVDIEAN